MVFSRSQFNPSQQFNSIVLNHWDGSMHRIRLQLNKSRDTSPRGSKRYSRVKSFRLYRLRLRTVTHYTLMCQFD